jgi:hypothetical protein
MRFVLAILNELMLATLNDFKTFNGMQCSCGVTVLFESSCERTGKWETYLILKENRSLVSV